MSVINGEITKTAETKFSLKIEEIVLEEKENYDGAEKKDKFTILSSLHIGLWKQEKLNKYNNSSLTDFHLKDKKNLVS